MTDQVIREGNIQEGQLIFTFSSTEIRNHQTINFDKSRIYENVKNNIGETKAIDILDLVN